MEIQYFGHSAFKLKGKAGIVVCDPFDSTVGIPFPSVSADVVTTSHDHFDHNAITRVKPTSRREKPFIIAAPGEYEVGGISIFGVPTFHDDTKGTERGKNTVFTIVLDHLRICHLGDLGHTLSDQDISQIGTVDILLVPVGGKFTITPAQAVEVISSIEPSYVIPMHYKTDLHNQEVFQELNTVDDFLKEYGVTKKAVATLNIEAGKLPEETEVVVLEIGKSSS